MKFITNKWIQIGTGLATGALLYAHYIEPFWLEVSHLKLAAADEWRGYKVAFLSDFHFDREKPIPTILKRAFEEVLVAKPNLVALGGDYTNGGKWNKTFGELIKPLIAAGLPVVAIMGNHDYYGRRGDALRTTQALEALGVKVLINEAYQLEYNGETAWLVGVDDLSKGEPDLNEILSKLPPNTKPRILLSHNPNFLDRLPANFADITLSGHTHGGQINPALPPFEYKLNWILYARHSPLREHSSHYPRGWYETNGNKLYVGRGLGTGHLRLRFNSRPELVMLEFI